jgi:hypothetical protein
MNGAVWVQTCAESDFDAATMTCAAPIWTPQVAGWPALSLSEAQEIGAAVALVLAFAWVIRRLKRQIDQA